MIKRFFRWLTDAERRETQKEILRLMEPLGRVESGELVDFIRQQHSKVMKDGEVLAHLNVLADCGSLLKITVGTCSCNWRFFYRLR